MHLRRSHAIALALIVAGGSLGAVAIGAADDGTASVLVPIAPCRLVDTRASSQVGPRFLPIGPGQTITFQVTGTNGNCTLPSGATAIASNVTTLNTTAPSYLTVFPADATRPTASNLNWNAGAPPTPNQVTVGLSATGGIKVFNLTGSVDVIIDIVGYYRAEGGSGSVGPTGATGATGATGVRGLVGEQCAATASWYDTTCRVNSLVVGTGPVGIAVTSNRIWIANSGSGTVTKINPNANTTIATVTVGAEPGPIAYDGTAIWVGNRGDGTVTRVDASANTVVTTIDVEGTPGGIATDGTSVWVTVTERDLAVRIDPASNAIVATAAAPESPGPIAFDGRHLWVGGTSAVRVIDPTTGAQVAEIPVASGPVQALQSDGAAMWVAADAPEILPIDLASRAAGVPVGLPDPATALAFDGDDVWVTVLGDRVVRVDPRAGTVRSTWNLDAGAVPQGAAYDGASVWVSASGGAAIIRFVP
ncbi:MAG: hypothetical protein RL531_1164 [Actinomycetota bacterium]